MTILKLCCQNFSQIAYIMIFFCLVFLIDLSFKKISWKHRCMKIRILLQKLFVPLIVRHCNLHRTVTYGSCSKPKTALPDFFFFSNVNKELAILMTGSKTKHCDLANFVMTSGTFWKLRSFFCQNAMSFQQCFLDMGKWICPIALVWDSKQKHSINVPPLHNS